MTARSHQIHVMLDDDMERVEKLVQSLFRALITVKEDPGFYSLLIDTQAEVETLLSEHQ